MSMKPGNTALQKQFANKKKAAEKSAQNRSYYQANREKILKARQQRYEASPEYKQAIVANVRKQYYNKKKLKEHAKTIAVQKSHKNACSLCRRARPLRKIKLMKVKGPNGNPYRVEMLTDTAVAAYLGVFEATFETWIHRKDVPRALYASKGKALWTADQVIAMQETLNKMDLRPPLSFSHIGFKEKMKDALDKLPLGINASRYEKKILPEGGELWVAEPLSLPKKKGRPTNFKSRLKLCPECGRPLPAVKKPIRMLLVVKGEQKNEQYEVRMFPFSVLAQMLHRTERSVKNHVGEGLFPPVIYRNSKGRPVYTEDEALLIAHFYEQMTKGKFRGAYPYALYRDKIAQGIQTLRSFKPYGVNPVEYVLVKTTKSVTKGLGRPKKDAPKVTTERYVRSNHANQKVK